MFFVLLKTNKGRTISILLLEFLRKLAVLSTERTLPLSFEMREEIKSGSMAFHDKFLSSTIHVFVINSRFDELFIFEPTAMYDTV